MFKTYSLFLFLAIATIAGCKKDELSRTKDNLTRSWTVSKVEFAGADSTVYWKSYHADYSLQFIKTGKYIESFKDDSGNPVSINGDWSLSADALTLTLNNTNKQPSRVYNLILVDEDNLNCSKVNSTPKETYYFKSN